MLPPARLGICTELQRIRHGRDRSGLVRLTTGGGDYSDSASRLSRRRGHGRVALSGTVRQRSLGKPDIYCGALFRLARGVHSAAVSLDQVLDDGESEPGSAFATRASRVDTVEALEDAHEMLRPHAGAGVLNTDGNSAVCSTGANDDLTRRSMPHRVVDEIGNHLAQCRWVGRSEEHTSELQSLAYLVCRLLLEKKKKQ